MLAVQRVCSCFTGRVRGKMEIEEAAERFVGRSPNVCEQTVCEIL